MAWCPTQPYSAPYHGLIAPGGENWKDKLTYYRYTSRPVMFEKSIRVTIEQATPTAARTTGPAPPTGTRRSPTPRSRVPALAARLPIYREVL
jgi:hypothetical protein